MGYDGNIDWGYGELADGNFRGGMNVMKCHEIFEEENKKPPLGGPWSHRSVAYEKLFLGMKS